MTQPLFCIQTKTKTDSPRGDCLFPVILYHRRPELQSHRDGRMTMSVFVWRLKSVRRRQRLSVCSYRWLRSFHFITHNSQVLSLICDPPLLWYLYDTASGCLFHVRIMNEPCVFVGHFKMNTRIDGVCSACLLPDVPFSCRFHLHAEPNILCQCFQ